MTAAVVGITSFEINDIDAGVTAILVGLAPISGDFIITWQSGTKLRVAKITPAS